MKVAVRRRVARSHAVRVVAICAAFAGMIAAGVHSAREFSHLLFGASSGRTVRGAGAPSEWAGDLRPLEPGDGFSQTRVGHLLISSHNKDECRRLLFDNRTGIFLDAGYVLCGQIPETPSDQLGQERAQTMLKAFRK